jgi:hypothetical protein
LRREIEAFEDTRASANAAITTLQQQKLKAMAIRDSAGKYAITQSVVNLVESETPLIIEAINAAGAALAAQIGRLQSLREFALAEARAHDEKAIFDAASRSLELERNNIVKAPTYIDFAEWRAAHADLINNASHKAA